MKHGKHIGWLTAVLCCALCLPALAETGLAGRLLSADEAEWTGEYLRIDGDLVRFRDGATVLSGVTAIDAWDGVTFAMTEEGPVRITEEGDVTPLAGWEEQEDLRLYGTGKGFAFFLPPDGETYVTTHLLVFDFVGNQMTADLTTGYPLEEYAAGGGRWLIVRDLGVFAPDGTQVLKAAPGASIKLEMNADLTCVTNGMLTGYEQLDGQSCAVVWSLETGEQLTRFPGLYWRPYDGQMEVFADNTAVMDDTMSWDIGRSCVVGLDGRILLDVTDGFLMDHDSFMHWYTYKQDDRYFFYDIYTGKTWEDLSTDDYTEIRYRDTVTQEVFDSEEKALAAGEPDPAMLAAYPPIREAIRIEYDWELDGYRVLNDDGTPLGDQVWSWIEGLPGEGIARMTTFADRDWALVWRNETEACVLFRDDRTLTPEGCDRIVGVPGYGFLACCADGWHLYDMNGQPID